jgi:PAS domain S-box-containing protein
MRNDDQKQLLANLTALVQSATDLMWSVDRNYRILTFNRALAENLEHSYGVRIAVGMMPADFLPAARAVFWPPMYERALSRGPYLLDYVLADGRTVEMAFQPILQDGQSVGVSVIGRDITEWKAAKRALEETEKRYRELFQNAVEGIFQTTTSGQALTANAAMARMLGYDSVAELVATLTDTASQMWLDADDRSRFVTLLEEQGCVLGYQCRWKRKDGTTIWVAVNCQKVCAPDGATAHYEGFIVNVTEH